MTSCQNVVDVPKSRRVRAGDVDDEHVRIRGEGLHDRDEVVDGVWRRGLVLAEIDRKHSIGAERR